MAAKATMERVRTLLNAAGKTVLAELQWDMLLNQIPLLLPNDEHEFYFGALHALIEAARCDGVELAQSHGDLVTALTTAAMVPRRERGK